MTASTTQAKGKAPRRAAAKPKRSGAQKRENRTGWAFMAPFAVLFAFVFILPIIWAIYSSFFRQVTEGGGAYGGGELVNKFVGFQNFQYVITSGNFWSGVGRVLLYTLIQVPIMIIAALALAMVIDSFVVKHVTGFRLGYFLPYAIPGVVASIIWVYLYNGQISPIVKGLAAIGVNVDFFNKNIVLGSMANITTWTFTGYNMLIFYSSLSTIPHSLYEAASIDGASEWQIVKKIKLPELKGSLAITVIFSIIGSFQLFNEPSILQNMVPGNAITTYYTPNMYAYNLSFTGNQSNYAAALAIVMAIITMAIAYVVQLKSMKEQMK